MFKKIKNGFTLSEILIALVVIAVITIAALIITIQQDKAREKQITNMTKAYYSDIESAYNQILNYNATNNTIKEIEDKNKDSKKDSKDLRALFNYYMDGVDVDCNKGKIKDITKATIPSNYLKSAVCSEHTNKNLPNKVIIGYYLNTVCNMNVTAKETYTKGSTTPRSVSNACGYIIYGMKGNKGNLGADIFVVPLGSDGLIK